MNRFLSKDNTERLLNTIQDTAIPHLYNFEKHRLELLDEAGNELAYLRLPITHPAPAKGNLTENKQVNYVILLIQSGNCALGYFEDGANLDHKVFRSYMVRKKQGKSQIKYLKTKGKSRAGSRVRLGETVEFFENINGRLQEYFEEHEVHRIAISCSKTLLPYLFGSKISPPFAKGDPRLFKIPKHIHTPIYDVLLDTNKYLMKGEFIYNNEAGQHMAADLLTASGVGNEQLTSLDEDEDMTSWE